MTFRPVIDGDLGLYLWQMPNGKYFGNGDGDFLIIESRHGDIAKMNEIYRAAKYYGAEGGRAVFISNARAVTQSEQEDQMERMLDGKTPDPYDLGALRDEVAAAKAHDKS